MAKRLGTLILLVIVLVVAGAITANLADPGVAIVTTSSPDASVFEATPVQSAMLTFWIVFVLINVLVVAGIAALLLFLGDRFIRSAKASPNKAEQRVSAKSE